MTGWTDEARKAALEARRRKSAMRAQHLASLPASKVNSLLDKYEKKSSGALNKALKVGSWKEGVGLQSFLKQNDPMARHYRFLSNRIWELRSEVSRRYGPGAPSRLPLRHKR